MPSSHLKQASNIRIALFNRSVIILPCCSVPILEAKVKLDELNDLADHSLERISQGDDKQFQELLSACVPFFLSVRETYGFFHIPVENIKEGLAAEAINKAFINHKTKNRCFSFYLVNAFRDCCRDISRGETQERLAKIVKKCGLESASTFSHGTQPIPSEVQAQRSEFVEQVCLILKDHPPFSKKLVFEKTRGSTYPEMADINHTSLNECKRVYQHDIYHIRKNISQDHHDEAKTNS